MIEFLRNHNACEEGIEWAVANCETLQDAWNKVLTAYENPTKSKEIG